MGAADQNPTPAFTGLPTPADSSAFSSFISSLSSDYAATASLPAESASITHDGSTTDDSSARATTSTGVSPISTAGAASATVSTTLSTAVSPTAEASSGLSGQLPSTATNAASNSSGATITKEETSCNSISCSSALKAAVAVPIVVAALAGLFLFFFYARKRRARRSSGTGTLVSEKKSSRKKWSRHLRVFSFDAELLMGGRFSSTNSLRSRDPSMRSEQNSVRPTSVRSAHPSLHSIEEVAPPYRDAVSHAQPPPTAAGAVAAGARAAGADPIPRPSSVATAPPPYGAVFGGHATQEPSTPVSGNPFADSAPPSPMEGSPFNDPPEGEEAQSPMLRPMTSGASSRSRSVGTASDAGSIREAQVGRTVSVMSRGRAIDNVESNNHSHL